MHKFSKNDNTKISIHGADRETTQMLSYGPGFVYDEFVITSGWLGALVYGVGFAVFRFLLFYSSPVSFSLPDSSVGWMLTLNKFRWFVKKFGLKPGEGPSEKYALSFFLSFLFVDTNHNRSMQNGFLETINITSSLTPQTLVKTVTRGKGDPGYSLTAGLRPPLLLLF